MKLDAEVEVPGTMRGHVIRLELDLTLGRGPALISQSNYDATLADDGDPGEAVIERGWVLLQREDKTVRERAIPGPVLDKLQANVELESFLYENALRSLPNE